MVLRLSNRGAERGYPGAKPAYRIADDRWDDTESMAALAAATFAELSSRAKQPRAKTKPARTKTPARRKTVAGKKKPVRARRG